MTPPVKLYRPRKLERVEVAWKDAQADSVYDGTVEGYADTALPVLEDIGYFVKLDKEVLVLASCREVESGTVRFMLKIPRKLVLEIRPLEHRGEANAL